MIINTAKTYLRNKNGFTLIELIVVFSVIAVLSTIGIASFVSYSRAQTLQQATNDFISVLNTAKARTAAQVKPSPECASSSTLQGYSVTVTLTGSSNTYALNVICSGVTTSIKTVSLPTGVTFNSAIATPPTTTTNVRFSVLSGGVTGSGNIVIYSYGSTKTVTVNSVGGIQ
jgi:prepilin-type N-terminal cleavage/methylation domain-containing protein